VNWCGEAGEAEEEGSRRSKKRRDWKCGGAGTRAAWRSEGRGGVVGARLGRWRPETGKTGYKGGLGDVRPGRRKMLGKTLVFRI
jgi:hypothetical protein